MIDPFYNVETDAVGYLTFSNGVRAVFDSSFNMSFRDEYEVVGTGGRIVVPRAYRPDNYGGDGLVTVKKSGEERTETINTDQYRSEVEHLSQAILDGKTDLYHDFDNTIDNMRVVDARYESIKHGESVKL